MVKYNRAVQPGSPIVVELVEPDEVMGLGQLMLEALGLAGSIAVGAALFGLVLAVVFIGYRALRARFEPEIDVGQTQSLGLTPPARK